MTQTDQQKGVPVPPPQKPLPENPTIIDLPDLQAIELQEPSLEKLIDKRRSRRKYTPTALTLEQLSYLCWATHQAVQKVFNSGRVIRTVPSAGSRHSFETYLIINQVDILAVGLYRYLAIEHKLLQIQTQPDIPRQCADACCDQHWMANAAVTFCWSAIPYRTQWRYGDAAGKLIALDAGHVCQNLYLASESIGAGCCAIAAYKQNQIDALLKLDGNDEFCVYLATVGMI